MRRAERKVADVAADERETPAKPRARDALSRPREHLFRAIDADDSRAGRGDRNSDASRAASEFEHGSILRGARAAARTRRPAAAAYGRFPSRRTARSRPSRASLRSCRIGPLTERGKQHRVLDLDERVIRPPSRRDRSARPPRRNRCRGAVAIRLVPARWRLRLLPRVPSTPRAGVRRRTSRRRKQDRRRSA